MRCLPTGALALALAITGPSLVVAGPSDDLSGYDEPPEIVDLTVVATISPDEGLIDLVTADDGAGLLAYVVADAATQAEVHVVEVATGAEVRTFDVSALSPTPQRMWFLGKGKAASIFVTALDADGKAIGAVYDGKGKKLRGFGPADTLTVITSAKGKPQIAVRKVVPSKTGETHQVELFEPTKKGKKIGKAKKLALTAGKNEKLGFVLNHWARDYTVAVGIKEGEWDKKIDARGSDRVARYDLVTGKMTTTAMGDLRDHRQRYEKLAGTVQGTTAEIASDLTGVELWKDDQPTTIALDAFPLYDTKSFAYAFDDDGALWVGLRVHPWNAAALKRKKADLEYFDLFHVDASGAATRKGRVLAPKGQFAIGATAGKVWLIERNVGFDRGGKKLTIYTPG